MKLWNSLLYKIVLKTHQVPIYTVAQLYAIWVASWNFKSLLNTILYENEFQIPQILQQTISLFPEQYTLA
jgi:hypothetical protein